MPTSISARSLIEARDETEFSYSELDEFVEKFLRVQADSVDMWVNEMWTNLVQPTQDLTSNQWWDDFGASVAKGYGTKMFGNFWSIHKYNINEAGYYDSEEFSDELGTYFANYMLERCGSDRRVPPSLPEIHLEG